MQNYYYQVLINGKAFPYEDTKILDKASAIVHLRQAEAIVRNNEQYKGKDLRLN